MLMSVMAMSYNIIGFRILKQGSLAVYSLFLMTGGMVLPYIWGVFFLNGSVSIISKMHQIETEHRCVSTLEFVILSGIFKFLIAGTLFAIFKVKNGQRVQYNGKSGISKPLLVITVSAVIGGCSYFLQLNGAKSLPATVLYPFITGGSIVFSALTDVLLFKTKVSKKLCVSMALCFVGTVMFL